MKRILDHSVDCEYRWTFTNIMSGRKQCLACGRVLLVGKKITKKGK